MFCQWLLARYRSSRRWPLKLSVLSVDDEVGEVRRDDRKIEEDISSVAFSSVFMVGREGVTRGEEYCTVPYDRVDDGVASGRSHPGRTTGRYLSGHTRGKVTEDVPVRSPARLGHQVDTGTCRASRTNPGEG